MSDPIFVNKLKCPNCEELHLGASIRYIENSVTASVTCYSCKSQCSYSEDLNDYTCYPDIIIGCMVKFVDNVKKMEKK